jgi:hypothetical protein
MTNPRTKKPSSNLPAVLSPLHVFHNFRLFASAICVEVALTYFMMVPLFLLWLPTIFNIFQ